MIYDHVSPNDEQITNVVCRKRNLHSDFGSP